MWIGRKRSEEKNAIFNFLPTFGEVTLPLLKVLPTAAEKKKIKCHNTYNSTTKKGEAEPIPHQEELNESE